MPKEVFQFTARQPGSPRRPRTHFFPGEAARILRLTGVDYRQIRRLFDLVAQSDQRHKARGPNGGRKWAKFTFRDLLGARIAIELAGGVEAIRRGDRLHLKPLETCVAALAGNPQWETPLLDLRWGSLGSSLFAEIDGVVMEPKSRQLLLREVVEGAARYLRRDPSRKDAAMLGLRREVQLQLRGASWRRQRRG